MLNRYWSRTSSGPESGVPFGPLRYRAWTSAPADTAAATGVPFGPLRYRAWTTGEDVTPPVVVPPPQAFITRPIKIDLTTTRRILREDEEIVTLLLALAASGALDGKGRS